MNHARARARALPLPNPLRSVIAALIAALVLAAFVPVVAVRAQDGGLGSAAGAAAITPETALVFLHATLNESDAQVQLAAELFERSGLLEEAGMGEDPLAGAPAGAEVALVVTSIPPPDNVDIDAVAMNPLAVTEELEEGGFAIIITADDPAAAYQMLLEEQQANVEFSGGELTEEDYNGVTISTWTPEPGDEYSDASSIALVGEFAVSAQRVEDLQPIIDTQQGTIAPLAEDADFVDLVGLVQPERLAVGYINGPELIAAVETAAPEAIELADETTTNQLNAWTAFGFSAEDAGFRLETRSIPAGTPNEAVDPLDGEFLTRVTGDALLVINGHNVNGTGLITSITAAIIGFSAFASEEMGTPVDFAATPVDVDPDQLLAETEALLGFNPQTDFIDQLVGEFGVAVSVDGNLNETLTIDAILTTELAEPLVVQDALSRLTQIAELALGSDDAVSIESRNVEGGQVTVITIPENEFTTTAEYGIVDDQLVISAGAGLDEYLAQPTAALADDPNFQAVMGNLPTEYGAVLYVNLAQVALLATDAFAFETEDSDPSCGEYATQEEAQKAYDEDQFANFLLDLDFDGEACEDFFAAPGATPTASSNPYPNLIGLATVTTQVDGVDGTSTFLMIGGA